MSFFYRNKAGFFREKKRILQNPARIGASKSWTGTDTIADLRRKNTTKKRAGVGTIHLAAEAQRRARSATHAQTTTEG